MDNKYEISKVFETGGSKYENIKITVKGDSPGEALADIYKTFYLDRAVCHLLANNSDKVEAIIEILQSIPAVVVHAEELMGE